MQRIDGSAAGVGTAARVSAGRSICGGTKKDPADHPADRHNHPSAEQDRRHHHDYHEYKDEEDHAGTVSGLSVSPQKMQKRSEASGYAPHFRQRRTCATNCTPQCMQN